MDEQTAHKFKVLEAISEGQPREFTVVTERTILPRPLDRPSTGARMQWRFYCEELNLVLVRHDLRRFVAMNDPSRVFQALDNKQTMFA